MKILPLSTYTPTEIHHFMLSGEPFVAARSKSDYWSYARFFGATCFCAQLDGELVAVLIAYVDQTNPQDIYVQDVLVSSLHQGKGIATALFTQLETAAKAHHCSRIWLTSEPGNNAIQAWGKLGFMNPPADYLNQGLHMTKDLKGEGKDRAVFEKFL